MTLFQFWIIIGSLAVIPLASGLARSRYRSAPLVASGVTIALFLLYLAAYAVWAASCPGCEGPGGPDWNRLVAMPMWYLMGGMFGGGALALVWIGAGLAALAGWLRRLEDPGRV